MKRYVIFALIPVLFFLTACDSRYTDTTQGQEAALTEENQQRLLKATPAPRLENSLEREQLVRRLIRFNNKNKVSYITLLSDMGQVITTIAIRGKVSSVNSLLTTPDQIVTKGRSSHWSRHVVSSPDLDGSYGSNGDAVFFFRAADDAYMEWNGKYFLSDQPVSMTTPPLITVNESK